MFMQGSDETVIDIHSHLIPKSYWNFLIKNTQIPKIAQTQEQYFLWFSNDLKYSIDKRMFSVEEKLKAMEKSKIDMQILSIAMPGVDLLNPADGLSLAKAINDEFAQVVAEHPGKFLGLATVPLQDVGQAIDELDRATQALGLRGVEIFSNVAGKTLDDEAFLPFFERIARLDVPILMHPTKPLMSHVMKDYGIVGAVGFLFDTTLATLRLILGGVLERNPQLKIILPHSGSTIPYLIGRIDNQFNINAECRQKISKLPSEYFKSIYVDTAQSFYEPALACAFSLLGPEKVLFGTDYPFADLENSKKFVISTIPSEHRAKVLCENAEKLFRIE
jgi:aminocarboxymuconate-semialdehyde decarboxylase